jgi:hypothetical protein
MKTGRDANLSGWYISDCCSKEVPFLKGQMFSRCPRCNALTAWEFVRQPCQAPVLAADPILNRAEDESMRKGIHRASRRFRLVL